MTSGRKTWLRIVVLLAAMLLLATSCGQEEEPGGATATTSGTGTGTEPTEGEIPEFSTIEEGILTVGSDIPYPPFEFRKSGEIVGFDIDLINEIASRFELETEFVDTSFETIFSQLAGGNFDVVVAASTITPEREQEVNFSDPYYNSQQSLTVQSGSGIESVDDLEEGMVVGVQSGTTGKKWAEENLPDGVEIRSFPEGPDGYTALEAADVDAVINDEPTALAEIEDREGVELVERIDTGEVYGIAVDPANEALLDAINTVLAEIIEDGTYQEIYEKYAGLPPGGSVAQE